MNCINIMTICVDCADIESRRNWTRALPANNEIVRLCSKHNDVHLEWTEFILLYIVISNFKFIYVTILNLIYYIPTATNANLGVAILVLTTILLKPLYVGTKERKNNFILVAFYKYPEKTLIISCTVLSVFSLFFIYDLESCHTTIKLYRLECAWRTRLCTY